MIVLGTSSSKSVLPRMINKLENLGSRNWSWDWWIPAGYSFNLDGTCIYLTMAAIFLAQATNTELTLWHSARYHWNIAFNIERRSGSYRQRLHRACSDTCLRSCSIPVASIALILGVDRFMSEARALTNLVGNGVATIVVSKWEDALDERRMRQHLDHETELEADAPERTMAA